MDRIWSLELVFLPSSENFHVFELRFSFPVCLVDFFPLAAARLDIISGKCTNYQVIL